MTISRDRDAAAPRGRRQHGAERLAMLLAACLALPPPVLAQPTQRDLRAAEQTAAQRREAAEEAATRARALAEEEVALAARRVELAAMAQAAEAEVAAVTERLEAARAEGATAAREIAERATAMRPLLPVMLRLSLYPAETVLAVPGEPADALRGALVLRGMIRRLEDEALALREAQTRAQEAEWLARREALALEAAEGAAREAVAGLEAELAVARTRRGEAEAAEERAATQAAAAAARASDLAVVLDRLRRERLRREAEARADAAARAAEQARQAAEAAREAALARRDPSAPRPAATPQRQASVPVPSGGRALPVAGRITTSWGEAAPGGPHRGLTYAAANGARVVSPCNGRAVYAAPFRSYGLLLIVDCGGGYHFVLAGMDRLDAAAGQRLLAGEPIGVLGGSGASGGSLYVELRRNGQPVDPRPWFAARG
ncbi:MULTISPECIES: murein hydrolase activator EnvC family protein [Roseomonadaceae]|uniref:Peptidoglycan DD-metalloendopeptidase family protein n=1 Tax=Falsiroseomonas oleicola TaxID=2801474 RepID=A0ABS6H764_9PROT|nr:peptidoglycan DD-metalloendopeptidase family protein [Roseomonas oleicola]MBU8544539.1 peptidoglycan DD-metalloendopeptidase family protein [Roseomonas oleicola]